MFPILNWRKKTNHPIDRLTRENHSLIVLEESFIMYIFEASKMLHII